MRDRKRRSKTKNGVFRSGFFDQKKKFLMRSDFGDFRAAFFDLAFSIATSYRNGGDFYFTWASHLDQSFYSTLFTYPT